MAVAAWPNISRTAVESITMNVDAWNLDKKKIGIIIITISDSNTSHHKNEESR